MKFIYKHIHTHTKVSSKEHKQVKIFAWNVTKWSLFFNIVLLAVHTLLPSEFQCLDPIGLKYDPQQIWHQPMNFTAHPHMCMCLYIYIYIYISLKMTNDLYIIYTIQSIVLYLVTAHSPAFFRQLLTTLTKDTWRKPKNTVWNAISITTKRKTILWIV